jgi:hypothetical protein
VPIKHLYSLPESSLQQLGNVLCGQPAVFQPGSDWPALVQMAVSEGVAPLLYDAIHRMGDPANIPVQAKEFLELTYRKAQYANTVRFSILKDVLQRFSAAGIPVIVLKGAALAELVYRKLGLRPMCDLDLLVRVQDVPAAIDLLHQAGYHPIGRPELRPGFALDFQSEFELRAPKQQVLVEIHWKLIAPIFACRHVDMQAVWERAELVKILGCDAYVLGPEDWILHQAAHAVYKHRRIKFLDLSDVARLLRHLNSRLNWERLLEIGTRNRWLPGLGAVLSGVETYLQAPLPQNVLKSIEQVRLPSQERWLVGWWMKPGRPERAHVVPDWLTLPSCKTRTRVLWAYLFPSREYLESCFPEWNGLPVTIQHLKRLWNRAR